jgi:TnpA family transposase
MLHPSAFGPEADDRNALLTVILADGINLGLTRMAETCRGASLRQLAHLHDWHISEAAYGEALGRLIDAHRAMPLAALWGDGTTSSSDGQQFHAGGRGAAIGDINARSGNEPGVAFYTHVSDRYGPFATRVIAATAGEAPYVLDGLLYQQTGLTIEEHYTDTGGASDHVFGLMPFFGYRFAPRLRDIKERRLHLLPGQEAGPLLAGMTGEPIALGHVAAHWDELLRFAIDPHRHRHRFSDATPPVRLSATEWTSPRVARAWPSRTLDLHARLVARHRPAPAHPGGPQ